MMRALFGEVLTIGIMALFVGVIGLAFFKGNLVAYASGTIYIRADGFVVGTDKITNVNNATYTFTDDINDSVVVQRSNIIVDGDGHTLNGSWSLMNGFNLTSVSNVTIMNVNIVEFGYAMWLEEASQCVISNSTCVDNEGGIWLVSSIGNTVSGNTVVRSVEGVALDSASGNTVVGNNITDSYNYGVYVRNNSTGNAISGNSISGTGNGAGIYLNGSPDNVISGNDVKDSPNEHVCLLYSSNGNSIFGNNLTNSTGDVGVYVYMCSLNSFFENNITGNAQAGIAFDVAGDSTISKNNISENWNGVYLWYSSNITVSENDITANKVFGVFFDNSGNSIVKGNNITDNSLIAGGSGIALSLSSNNVLSGNNIISNNYWGINPADSNNNTISGNNIIDNNVGINSASSNFNIVSANNIIGNVYSGIYLESSSNNTFHHNNLINNTNQVVVDEPGYANNWDNGYPSGGNYWSDYMGDDDFKGPDQDIPGSDFIGDDWYVIDENNTDHYPLMMLYETTPPSIAILSPENRTYAVSSGIPLNFSVDEFASWVGYSLDGQLNVTVTGSVTLPSLLDGGHSVVVYANDTFGNMGFAIVYFAVDTVKPNITDVMQDPLTNILPDTVVKINATVTDATSGIKQVILNYTTGDGTWISVEMANMEGEIWNATMPTFPYGTNVTYVIIAEDNVGNTITSEEIFGYEYGYPVVPELQLLAILCVLITATLLTTMISRRKKHFLHETK